MPARPYLRDIVAAHRAVAAADGRDLEALRSAALDMSPGRGFQAALRGQDGHLAVVAEIKRRSPSKGDLDPDLDPAAVAREFAAAGAACLSVLTDQDAFGGSVADLQTARGACGLPVLRKDFTVGATDVYDARIMGADAVLLIVAALSDDELTALHVLAVEVGLDVLVEVHDEDELTRALALDPHMVGVNQRDLATFEVDHQRALRMADALPDGVVAVAESGVRHEQDAQRLAAAGYDAVLVGETLMRTGDRAAALRQLRAPVVGRRTRLAHGG